MAYIAPNTSVILYGNVPLDRGYNNTYYWPNKSTQDTFFLEPPLVSGISIIRNLSKYYYVRDGVLKVQVRKEDLEGCNYMRFVNNMDIESPKTPKVFYAFVDEIRWVNNETSEIYYTVDIMQTYAFDYTLLESFVAREHSSTDEIGDNLIPEDVALSEYVYNNYNMMVSISDYAIMVCIVDSNEVQYGGLASGVFSGGAYYAFDTTSTGISALKTLLASHIQNPEEIVSMYMCPKIILGTGITIPNGRISAPTASIWSGTPIAGSTLTNATIDGYTPKNNKLFTYPFNCYILDNGAGSTLILRYELFEDKTIHLTMYGSIMPPVELVVKPNRYKNVNGSSLGGYPTLNTESLSISNFPLCSWNFDAFQNWIATGMIPAAIKTASNIIKLGVDKSSAVDTAGGILSKMYEKSIEADIAAGSFSNGNAMFSNNKKMFYGGQVSIMHECAETIDNYFTMFGYACHKVKVPNINARSRFNYIRTVNCNLRGNAPSNVLNSIREVFDKGVTFWKDYILFGNYQVQNNLPT